MTENQRLDVSAQEQEIARLTALLEANEASYVDQASELIRIQWLAVEQRDALAAQLDAVRATMPARHVAVFDVTTGFNTHSGGYDVKCACGARWLMATSTGPWVCPREAALTPRPLRTWGTVYEVDSSESVYWVAPTEVAARAAGIPELASTDFDVATGRGFGPDGITLPSRDQ